MRFSSKGIKRKHSAFTLFAKEIASITVALTVVGGIASYKYWCKYLDTINDVALYLLSNLFILLSYLGISILILIPLYYIGLRIRWAYRQLHLPLLKSEMEKLGIVTTKDYMEFVRDYSKFKPKESIHSLITWSALLTLGDDNLKLLETHYPNLVEHIEKAIVNINYRIPYDYSKVSETVYNCRLIGDRVFPENIVERYSDIEGYYKSTTLWFSWVLLASVYAIIVILFIM